VDIFIVSSPEYCFASLKLADCFHTVTAPSACVKIFQESDHGVLNAAPLAHGAAYALNVAIAQ
jgi:hypothetical protein